MKPSYKVIVDADAKDAIELRGDCRKAMACRDAGWMLSGPADTSKTFTCCAKMHLILSRYPGAQGAMARKTYKSIVGTCGKTFERIIAGSGVETIGGEFPTRYIYPNGSTLWVGGMDNPDKILSAERDFIYFNQAEELEKKDWETASTRTSGRNSVIRSPQLFGDCNPGGSKHWIKELAKSGALTLFTARHQDNPTVYHQDGSLTVAGEKILGQVLRVSGLDRIRALEKLTGVRRKRLFEGIWATAEGAVYDMFDSTPGRHVITRDPREMVRWFLAIDDGFTNPAAILLIGADTDGRWHVFREWYQTGMIQEKICKEAKRWNDDPMREFGIEGSGKLVELCGVDEAAASLIAGLSNLGINAVAGKGGILDGIRLLQDRLEFQADGKARLTVDPSCIETINEFESYIWKPEKDVPVDKDNHALGALRYLQDALGEIKSFDAQNIKGVSTGGMAQAAGLEQPRVFVPRTFTPTKLR